MGYSHRSCCWGNLMAQGPGLLQRHTSIGVRKPKSNTRLPHAFTASNWEAPWQFLCCQKCEVLKNGTPMGGLWLGLWWELHPEWPSGLSCMDIKNTRSRGKMLTQIPIPRPFGIAATVPQCLSWGSYGDLESKGYLLGSGLEWSNDTVVRIIYEHKLNSQCFVLFFEEDWDVIYRKIFKWFQKR